MIVRCRAKRTISPSIVNKPALECVVPRSRLKIMVHTEEIKIYWQDVYILLRRFIERNNQSPKLVNIYSGNSYLRFFEIITYELFTI